MNSPSIWNHFLNIYFRFQSCHQMCGGRFKLIFWLLTFLLFGISGLCVYLTIRRKALEKAYMYCALSGSPFVQGKSTSGQSLLVQSDIVSPAGYTGNCLFISPCTDNACTAAEPLPTQVRCWAESLDSSVPICSLPEALWRTYMYTCGGFALGGCLFFVIAMYLSGCCRSRDDYYDPSSSRKPKSIPLSSRF